MHDVAAGKTRFVDYTRYSHKLLCWAWTLDEAFYNLVESAGRTGQQNKDGLQAETQHPEATRGSKGKRGHYFKQADLSDSKQEPSYPGIMVLFQRQGSDFVAIGN